MHKAPKAIVEQFKIEGFIPAKDVAKLVGIAISTVHRSCVKGSLESRRWGSHWFVKEASIEKVYGPTALSGGRRAWMRRIKKFEWHRLPTGWIEGKDGRFYTAIFFNTLAVREFRAEVLWEGSEGELIGKQTMTFDSEVDSVEKLARALGKYVVVSIASTDVQEITLNPSSHIPVGRLEGSYSDE